MATTKRQKGDRYELADGVNRVRIGSLVVGAAGHVAASDAEAAALEKHPALAKAVQPKKTVKAVPKTVHNTVKGEHS